MLGQSYRGITAQFDAVQKAIQQQDGRIEGQEARLRAVETTLMAIQRIDGSLDSIRERITAQSDRMSKLESLVQLSQQVELNTRRLDKLEVFTQDSTRDRAAMNAKLEDIKAALSTLMSMHTAK